MNADPDASSHWLTLELLSRYTEAVRAGLNAERLYPQVHRHLALCEPCRATLGDLSLPLDASTPHSMEYEPRFRAWLAHLESPANVRWAWRPGSHPASFGLHLSMNTDWLLTIASPAAHNPGISLDFPWPSLTEDVLRTHLEIIPATAALDRHTLVMRLAPGNFPTRAHAHLLIGRETHHAGLRDGRLKFVEITLEEGVKRIGLMLESL